MAEVRISDVVVPENFEQYFLLVSEEKSRFRASGVIADNERLNNFLKPDGGTTVNLPYWNDLAQTEENVSTDDPADVATPDKITTGQEIARRQSVNMAWSSMDLSSDLAGEDPMVAIATRVGSYWAKREQKRIIATFVGIVDDNIAGAGDFVNDISLAGAGTPGVANFFSAEAVIDTLATMGDSIDEMAAVAFHSIVHARARKNDLIDFVSDSTQTGRIEFFYNMRVIVDDGLPTPTGPGPATQYWTMLFAPGVVARGIGSARVPVEIEREALTGNGGGQETLVTRQEWGVHPRGFAWADAPGVARVGGPSIAELEDPAHWSQVYPERQQIKFAVLISNG